MSRPTRRQLTAARKLSRTQRRLDRVRPDSRRGRKLAAKEAARGARFDKATRPTRRHAAVRAELAAVTTELDASRSASFERARTRRSGRSRARTRVKVYD